MVNTEHIRIISFSISLFNRTTFPQARYPNAFFHCCQLVFNLFASILPRVHHTNTLADTFIHKNRHRHRHTTAPIIISICNSISLLSPALIWREKTILLIIFLFNWVVVFSRTMPLRYFKNSKQIGIRSPRLCGVCEFVNVFVMKRRTQWRSWSNVCVGEVSEMKWSEWMNECVYYFIHAFQSQNKSDALLSFLLISYWFFCVSKSSIVQNTETNQFTYGYTFIIYLNHMSSIKTQLYYISKLMMVCIHNVHTWKSSFFLLRDCLWSIVRILNVFEL